MEIDEHAGRRAYLSTDAGPVLDSPLARYEIDKEIKCRDSPIAPGCYFSFSFQLPLSRNPVVNAAPKKRSRQPNNHIGLRASSIRSWQRAKNPFRAICCDARKRSRYFRV